MKTKNKGPAVIEVLNDEDFETATWVCLFHGYGANAEDLYPLHHELDPENKFNWLFPQAPLEVPIDLFSKGYAWWPIDLIKYQQALLKKDFSQLSTYCPPELTSLRTFFSDFFQNKKIPTENLILGGFSQGAMLAADLTLHAPRNPKGLLLFSGALVCQDLWKSLSKKRSGTSFFQSHGQQDAILSLGQAQRLYQILKEAGLQGRFHEFTGGHEIPHEVIHKARLFLNSL